MCRATSRPLTVSAASALSPSLLSTSSTRASPSAGSRTSGGVGSTHTLSGRATHQCRIATKALPAASSTRSKTWKPLSTSQPGTDAATRSALAKLWRGCSTPAAAMAAASASDGSLPIARHRDPCN
eukprot:3946901-Prymnesium_polylepis.1